MQSLNLSPDVIVDVYNAALNANKEIVAYIQKPSKEDFLYRDIGFGGDLTAQIDFLCERIFSKHLLDFCNIYSEESGLIQSKKAQIPSAHFILDPLDGSDNFLANIPYYGSSLALIIQKEVLFSMVYNFITNRFVYKIRNELYTFAIYSNMHVGIFERAYANPQICLALKEHNLKFRSLGAVALSFAYARSYLFVLFYGKYRSFDLEAALHINSDLNIFQDDNFLLIAQDPRIFNTLKQIILLGYKNI